MANVTVTYKSDLAERIGSRTEAYDAATIKDLLGQIKTRHGVDVYKIAKSMLITINALSIQKQHHFATRLSEGDVVGFFPLAAGG